MMDMAALLSQFAVAPGASRQLPEPDVAASATLLPELVKDEELREATVENILGVYRTYKQWREDEVEPIWDAMIRAYRGLKQRNPNPYRYQYIIREIFRQVETLKPQITRQFFSDEKLFKYQPRVANFEDQAAAATDLVHYQIKKYRILPELKNWIDTTLLYGVSYMTYGWRRFKHTSRKIVRMHQDDKKPLWKRETSELVREAPYLEFLRPREVYTHPFVEDPRNSPMVVVRKVVSTSDLKTLVREGWLDADAAAEASAQGNPGVLQAMSELHQKSQSNYEPELDLAPDGEDPHEMLVVWTNDGFEYVVLDNRHLLRAAVLPLGEVPILTQRNYPQAGEHYGIPEPLVILDDQRVLNDLMSMYVDGYHYTCNPMFKVKRGSAEKQWGMTTFKPGGKVVVDSMDDVMPLDVRPIEINLSQQAQFVLQRMKLATGLTDELAGSGSSSKTATGLVRLQDAAGARMEHKVRCFTEGMREAYAVLYDLNADHLDEEVALRIEGENGRRVFKRYGPEVFDGEIDVDVQLSNQDDGPESMNKWLQAYQMMGQNPMINQPLLIEKVLRTMGEKRPRAFMVNPALTQQDALAENAQYESFGTLPEPLPSDNHQMHLQIHQQATQSVQEMSRLPGWTMELQRHMSVHQAYLQQQQQQAGAASQAPAGGEQQPGGPGGSPEADARTEAMFSNGQVGAQQQGAMMPPEMMGAMMPRGMMGA